MFVWSVNRRPYPPPGGGGKFACLTWQAGKGLTGRRALGMLNYPYASARDGLPPRTGWRRRRRKTEATPSSLPVPEPLPRDFPLRPCPRRATRPMRRCPQAEFGGSCKQLVTHRSGLSVLSFIPKARRDRPRTAPGPMLRKRSRCIFHRTGGKRPDKLCKPPFPSPDAFATLHSSLQKRPRTPSEHQHNRTANSVAVVLHECCTTFAALLHRLCSSAAKAMQHCCKGCAVELQRLCRKRAEARQENSQGKVPREWANRSRPGKVRVPRMAGRRADVYALASVRRAEECMPFLPSEQRAERAPPLRTLLWLSMQVPTRCSALNACHQLDVLYLL